MPDTASSAPPSFELFLTAPPGLEPYLCEEAHSLGYPDAEVLPGGVMLKGTWQDIWRLNVSLRGATRVLARFAAFRAPHLAQLDKRARRVPWSDILRPDVPVRVEASCTRSRIYHDRAAAQRIERALHEELGVEISADAPLRLMARIEDDLCTLSLDTSGAPLHQRGTKQAVGKAPLRESLAALLLRAAAFDPAETVVDPMCGSGTIPLEAAGIASGRLPGIDREYAFMRLPSFDDGEWQRLLATPPTWQGAGKSWGYDRDQGAIAAATANAMRAGLDGCTTFVRQPVSALRPPTEEPGLVMTNPPYGARIGNKNALRSLYFSFGDTLMRHFSGWRVAFITSEPSLARATGLPLLPNGPPIPHGGLKIRLYQTGRLP